MGDWKDHGSETGGWYTCNIAKNATGELAEKIKNAAVGAAELKAYSDAMTYFEKNQLHEKHAIKMLGIMEERIIALHALKGKPASES